MNRNNSSSIWQRWALRYGLAFVAVAAGFGLRLALTAWIGPGLPTYITFYPAVMVAALLAGFGPGLLATALADLTAACWILPPAGQFAVASPVERLGLMLFAGMGVFMSAVAEFYRRDRRKAAAYNREMALRETRREKEFLADVLEHASQPFAVGYPDGRIGLCNRAYEQLTGYSEEELRAFDWATTLTPPEWRELERQKLEELHLSGQPVRYEKEYLRKDGTRVPVELLVHLMKDAGGKPEYYSSFLTDITERKRVQTVLRESEDRLRFALETSHIGAWDLDLVDHTAFHSLEHDRIFGYAESLPQWTYEKFLEHVLPEDRAAVEGKFRQAMESRSDWSFECRIHRTDGQIRWIWAAGRHRPDAAGVPRRMAGIVQDITERKLAEEALRRSTEKLEQRVAERTAELRLAARYSRSLLEASLDPLVTISPEGKVTDVNQATELVTGVPREQLIGTDFVRYFTEPQKAEAGYEKVLAEGQVRDYPLTIQHTSGRQTDVLYHATVYKDAAGRVQGVFAAARDVTEAKEAARRRDFTNTLLALFAQKTSAQEYLDSVVEVIRQWTGCQASGIHIMNKHQETQYESWTGFDPAFIGREHRSSRQRDDGAEFGFASFAIIPIRYHDEVAGDIHLADRRPGRFTPAIAEFIESMSPLIGEAVHRFQTEAELAKHRERLEELVKQRTSELERSNRDLEQFAYVASHDLQEPLRAVGGYVKLLQHRFPETLDAKAREYVAGAADGAERMQRLIADLLAFSRVGTRGGAFAPADLNALLRDAVHNLQTSITEAGAKVTSDPLPSLPVDATQIVQLFQNLIGNAIKFRSERAPEIQVGARKEKERWLFWVRDNGIGIEPQYSGRIFQIFQRLHTRTQYPGTGIGLAICQKIVERHDGNIWVESQPAQGSTFYFSIPEISAKKE
ncbi:MAG: PAS domain S-box protein [Verrucomicrobiota bacterium]|jgi:PAS domain S-box-containing protein